jgi:hypothetical protein
MLSESVCRPPVMAHVQNRLTALGILRTINAVQPLPDIVPVVSTQFYLRKRVFWQSWMQMGK